MSFRKGSWKPLFLLLLREFFWFVPKEPEILPELPVLPLDFTEWYRSSGMPEAVVSVRVLFEYRGIATVLKNWKYGRDGDSERQIADAYANALKRLPDFPDGSSVAYVPLGMDRWQKRWFNQSECLAKILGRTLVFRFFMGFSAFGAAITSPIFPGRNGFPGISSFGFRRSSRCPAA